MLKRQYPGSVVPLAMFLKILQVETQINDEALFPVSLMTFLNYALYM